MVEKRKRPIEPTAKPGEEPDSTRLGSGHKHQIELEGEEIELRQTQMREATESIVGGMDVSHESLPVQHELSSETDEAFNDAVEHLDPKRQHESIMKRKRAA